MENKIDLNTCSFGDTLIGSHGAILTYVSKTPWRYYSYLDHVVMYIRDNQGKLCGENSYGTRTNDGFVFKHNRKPEIDEDIVKIIHTSKIPVGELGVKSFNELHKLNTRRLLAYFKSVRKTMNVNKQELNYLDIIDLKMYLDAVKEFLNIREHIEKKV